MWFLSRGRLFLQVSGAMHMCSLQIATNCAVLRNSRHVPAPKYAPRVRAVKIARFPALIFFTPGGKQNKNKHARCFFFHPRCFQSGFWRGEIQGRWRVAGGWLEEGLLRGVRGGGLTSAPPRGRGASMFLQWGWRRWAPRRGKSLRGWGELVVGRLVCSARFGGWLRGSFRDLACES